LSGNRKFANVTQRNPEGTGLVNDRSFLYEYDGLNRLIRADMGTLNSDNTEIIIDETSPSLTRETEWHLDNLGNWAGDETGSMVQESHRDDGTSYTYGVHHGVNSANQIMYTRTIIVEEPRGSKSADHPKDDDKDGGRDDDPDLTLKGYWKFDEGSDQTASDNSSYGNNGTLGSTPDPDFNDPSWVDGIINGALEFDGDDIVTTPVNIEQHEDSLGATFCAWVHLDPDDNPGRHHVISSDGGAYCDWSILIWDHKWHVYAGGEDSDGHELLYTGFEVDSEGWHHVAGITPMRILIIIFQLAQDYLMIRLGILSLV